MDCDIVLLPDESLAGRAIALSRELKRPDSVFTLEDGRFYPHLSLYMLHLQQENIPVAAERLREIAADYPPFQLRATHYDQERAYVVVDYTVPAELEALQRAVVAAINPIRDGIMDKDRLRISEATGEAKRNHEAYGYKYVGGLFKPHITLARFENENPIDLNALPESMTFDGTFARLGLFELGISNTCVRKLAEFPLQGYNHYRLL